MISTWLELPPSTAHDATPASAAQESKVSAPFSVAQVVVLAALEHPRMIVVVPTTFASTNTPPIWLVLWMATSM